MGHKIRCCKCGAIYHPETQPIALYLDHRGNPHHAESLTKLEGPCLCGNEALQIQPERKSA